MKKCLERLYNGIIKENPTFVLMLGMCATLAVTTSAKNAVGMGLSTAVVLICSNAIISALRKVIPDGVRIPAFIVVVASFTTIVQMFMKAYFKDLNDALGVFIPLIVVNWIILGRAEAYASKNPILPSIFDGIGMGIGFTIGVTSIAIVRELIGAGTIFGFQIMPEAYEPIAIFTKAPGAFLVLACLTALQNKFKLKGATNGSVAVATAGCGGRCDQCAAAICAENHAKILENKAEAAKAAKAKAEAAKEETK